jgi:hypothetical protein
MAVHKIILDHDFAEDCTLIAIHCSEDAFKMAFALNKYVNLRLQRERMDLDYSNDGLEVTFPLFRFEDEFQYTTYYLVANRCTSRVEQLNKLGGLFGNSVSERTVNTYLIPELKNVDYFLKIETDFDSIPTRKHIAQINEVREVISAYIVEDPKIKAHTNLIFD